MSYEIIYDKQFIKVAENKFVPMVLAGSNNCTEISISGRERRERSWFVWNMSNKLVYSLEEMVAYANKLRENAIKTHQERKEENPTWWTEDYNDNNFGWFTSVAINGRTSQTTFGQFKGVFTTGCKKALTIGQLIYENVNVYVENNYYRKEEQDLYKIPTYCKLVNSGTELLEAIEEFNEIFKGTNQKPTIRFSGMGERTPKRLRLRYFKKEAKPKAEKKEIKVDEFYSIVAPNGFYFVKRTRSGYHYTSYPYLKFLTEKEAQRKIKNFREGFKVELVHREHTFFK